MNKFCLVLVASVTLASGVAAHADTTYNVTGTFSDVAGSPLTGTYTINASDVVTAADLTLQGITFNILDGSTAPIAGITTYTNTFVDTVTNPSDYIELEILGSSTVCSAQIYTCTFFGGPQLTSAFLTPDSQLNLISGSASPETSATPEPSTMLLFGTGLLGLAFVAFRKVKIDSAFMLG
jgi:PEP-CTERM motif